LKIKELIYDFIQFSLEMRANPTNCRRAVRNMVDTPVLDTATFVDTLCFISNYKEHPTKYY